MADETGLREAGSGKVVMRLLLHSSMSGLGWRTVPIGLGIFHGSEKGKAKRYEILVLSSANRPERLVEGES